MTLKANQWINEMRKFFYKKSIFFSCIALFFLMVFPLVIHQNTGCGGWYIVPRECSGYLTVFLNISLFFYSLIEWIYLSIFTTAPNFLIELISGISLFLIFIFSYGYIDNCGKDEKWSILLEGMVATRLRMNNNFIYCLNGG